MPPKAKVGGKHGGGKHGGAKQDPPQQVGLSQIVSKKKTANISQDIEAQVKSLLASLKEKNVGAPVAAVGSSDTQRAAKQYTALFDQLMSHGFKQPHVEQVLRALPLGGASLEAALDWLCLHLPQSELPKQFAGGVRAGGAGAQVRVVSVAQQQQQQQQEQQQQQQVVAEAEARGVACDAYSAPSEGEESKEDGVNEDEEDHESDGRSEGGGDEDGGKEGGQDEREAAKAWIRQQYMEGSGTEGEEASSSSESDFDDWELWADPREVQRRKQERALAKIPPEVRRRQVAHDMAQAKQYAANAKASRDKNKQREAGNIIRDLRSEMMRLNLSEEAAAAIVEEDKLAGGGGAQQGNAKARQPQPQRQQQQLQQQQQQLQQQQQEAAGDMVLDPFAEDEAAGRAAHAAGSHPRHQPEDVRNTAPGAAGMGLAESVDDDWEAAFDLFGDESGAQGGPSAASAEGHEGSRPGVESNGSSATPSAAQEAPSPSPAAGVAGANGGVAGRGVGKQGRVEQRPAPPPLKQQQQQQKGGAQIKAALQPRALLFQQCQRARWAQPRYDKLPGPAMQYSVTIDMGHRAPKGSVARRRGLVGVRTIKMPEATDGAEDEEQWVFENSQDAQNAVATRALFELFGEEQALHHSMAPPFKDMWLRWESKGAQAQQADESEMQQARDDFVQQLLAEKLHEAQTHGSRPSGATSQPEGVGAAAPDLEAKQQGGGLHDSRAVDTVEQEEWRELLEDTTDDSKISEQQQQQQEGDADNCIYRPDVPQTPAERRASEALRTALENWWTSPPGIAMLAGRRGLPISAVRDGVMSALRQHDVIVVSGDTGCGKTTQVPQYLLEDASLSGQGARCNIVCTQPRRIAAISVAERVAAERGEPAPASGPPGASTVGYHVRLDAAVTRETHLTFCTTGILLRRLAADPLLASVSHVVVDEVHERSLQSDFLMALLKELVARRHGSGVAPLKVILMSATLDAEAFGDYFGGCPVLTAEGRTYPVEALFLEDVYYATGYRLAPDAPAAMRSGGARASANAMRKQAGGGSRDMQKLLSGGWGDEEKSQGALNPYYNPDLYLGYDEVTRRNLARVNEDAIDFELLEELLAFIDDSLGQESGAILVFLPGMGEISQLLSRLSSIRRFSRGGHWVVPLHSSVSPADQRQAFKIPPKGVRKIVLATNIAETSLTIEDVVAVVDTGKHKERRYDPARRMSLLVTDWVSRASAKQRKGRAGRVRPGTCFCLYTKDRFETLMRPFGAPEIVRVPLEELVLQIHLMGLGTASSFLEKVLQPPPQKSVAAAVATLREVGAFPSEGPEVLTPLGHHLAQLPVDPRLGKLLVLGCVLGCLGPAASVAAAMSHKQPFVAPLDKRDDAEKARRSMAEKGSGNIASGQQSDHLLLVAAISGWLALGADTRKPQAQQVHLRGYLKKFFLHEQTLKELQEMREQFASMLEDARLVSPRRHTRMQLDLPPFQHWLDDKDAPWNRHARTPAVVKALLAASLVPNVASMSEASAPASPPMWLTPVNRSGGGAGQGGGGQLEEVFIHPSSLCYNLNTNSMSQPFVVYLEKVKTSRTFLRDVTPVSPISLMLFGGPLTVLHQEGAVLVDGWIRVRAAAQTAVVVKALREALDRLLQEKVKNPSLDLSGPRAEVIPTIARLLQEDEHHHQHQL